MCFLRLFIFAGVFFSPVYAGWDLVWSDEFNYEGLPDATKWDYDVGTGSNGWGNNELEYYTKDSLKNAQVKDGTLIITAMKEQIAQSKYSSARLITKNKGDWLYGRFEIAAKVPKGVGLWPAIWMLPTDWKYGGWPASGELDIMENVGFDSMRVHFNIHTEAYNHSIGTNKGATVTLDDPHTDFNVYAMEWYEDSVVFFVNDTRTFMFENDHKGDYTTWPFDKRFHLLLNIAVGGSWGGMEGVDDNAFPGSMVVEYVRVYRHNSTSVTHHRLHRNTAAVAIGCRNGYLTVTGATEGQVVLYSLHGRALFTATFRHGIASDVLPEQFFSGVYAVAVQCTAGCFYMPFGRVR